MENVDLKEIERRAYLSYHKDGILDIYLGMGIMTIASVFYFEVFVSIISTIAILPILYTVSKKQYTIPRLGYVAVRTPPMPERLLKMAEVWW